MFQIGETVVSDLMGVTGVVVEQVQASFYAIKDNTGYVWHFDKGVAELRKATAQEIKTMIDGIGGK